MADLPAYRPGKGAAQAEAEHGIRDAVKLASNETPWGPIDAVTEAVRDAATGANRYADHRATAVRAALADRLGLDVGRVTVGAGSVGLLQQLALAYLDPGDEVVYPWRSFEVYPVYTQLMGAVAVTPPLVDHRFDLDAVAAALTERTKLVLLASPNNPTGTALALDAVRRLLERVPDGTLVVLDEAYREFVGPAIGDPVPALVDAFDSLVVLRTFSKAQGLAGLRLGYGIGHPSVIETIDKTLFPFAVNALAQAAALAALGSEDEIRDRVERIVAERGRVAAELRAAGWEIPDSEANFVWLPVGPATDDLYLRLEKEGVVTRPFSGEGLRVTIGTPAENDRFLETLARVTV